MEEADIQFAGHRGDLPVEKALGHGGIEEGGEHPAVHDAGIALQAFVTPELRHHPAIGQRGKAQAEGERVVPTAHQAVTVAEKLFRGGRFFRREGGHCGTSGCKRWSELKESGSLTKPAGEVKEKHMHKYQWAL